MGIKWRKRRRNCNKLQ